jgi:hypothetical protein
LGQSWPVFSRFANCDGGGLQNAKAERAAHHMWRELTMGQPYLVSVPVAWRLLVGVQRRDWGIAYPAEFSGEAIGVVRFPISLVWPFIAALRR